MRMNTLEFLQRVLPSDGYYAIAAIKNGAVRHVFSSVLEDIANAAVEIDKHKSDTYYAVASYKEKGPRKQNNVHKIKLVALDIDCGQNKPYPSWKEGLQALVGFVDALELPRPMIVRSGSGLHVYWVLDKDVTPQEWKPVAEAMKAAALGNDLHIDPAITADSARILRPVGLYNYKGDKPIEVKLLLDATPVNIGVLKLALMRFMAELPEAKPEQPKVTSNLLRNLAVDGDFPPGIAHIIKAKCKQVEWCVDNQDKVDEPLWYSLLGIAAFCHDSEEVAQQWSKEHPDYDPRNTLKKLYQWKESVSGPTTCAKFQQLRPKGCADCLVKGAISSPIRLGAQHKEVAIDSPIDPIASQLTLPKPYKRTEKGIKVTISETDIDVCPFDVYPVGYGKDESLGYEVVRYHWKRPHVGWQELKFRQAYLADGNNEFTTAIADQGIVLYNRKITGYFQDMLRSYMDELRKKRSLTNLFATMGLKESFDQFVIGDTVYKRELDGTVRAETATLSSTSQRIGEDFYNKQGTLDNWKEMVNVFHMAGMPWHEMSMLIGLSAPLYAFTGLKGIVVSLYGPTGGGKTLVQYAIQSAWGDPDKLHFAAKYTSNSLYARLGLLAHMPMTVDEVTSMADKEVGEFAYGITQGRDKARLDRNAAERTSREWATPVIVSTNRSLQSKLDAAGMDNDAQAVRILELDVPTSPLFAQNSRAGRMIYEAAMNNYGHAGEFIVIKLLEMGDTAVRAIISEAIASFNERYDAVFKGEERYWEVSIVLADLIGRLGYEWGLLPFTPEQCILYTLKRLGVIRAALSDSRLDELELLAEYLNEHAADAVTVMHTGGKKPMVDMQRVPRGSIYIRFDVMRDKPSDAFDKGLLSIDRTHLKRWLSVKGIDYKTYTDAIDKMGALGSHNARIYMGKDTPVKTGQTRTLQLDLTHPRLLGLLNEAEVAAQNMVMRQLRSVSSTN
jgi:hypothetical protein